MPLHLMYITNVPEVAALAETAGVDRIFVDLELLGKDERQGHMNTVISRHTLDDVARVRPALHTAQLLVRVNPLWDGSANEIDAVIERGADIVMLPMFTTRDEAARFIDLVHGRAQTMLLLETPAALARIDDILDVPGIDMVHIGLNDMHLGMGLTFMFEVLSGGLVEYIAAKCHRRHIPYGFGGIARIGHGMLPAECIIPEHYRLGSQAVILSRSFCDANQYPVEQIAELFQQGVRDIRAFEAQVCAFSEDAYAENRLRLKQIVDTIVQQQLAKHR